MGKIFYLFYLSALAGLFLAILSFQSFWLEMRVNIGLLIPVYAAVVFVALAYVLRREQRLRVRHKWFALGSLLATSAASLLILGFTRLKVVPAAIVREGLSLVHTPYSYLNVALGAFFLAGLLIIFGQKVDNEDK